jgi:hypothetical protein
LSVSIHALAIEPCITMLETLAYLLRTAGKQSDLGVLLRERLAPDMFPLRVQVQLALHQAKEMAALLLQETPPPVETPKCTPEALLASISDTIAYLRTLPARDFVHANDLQLVLDESVDGAVIMRGPQYVQAWALPNFHFHVVTAYAIMRHAGIKLGKADYLINLERYRLRPVMPL